MRVLALWAIAALLALFVATHQPPPQDADLPVLVTRQFIPAGTSGSQIAAGKMVVATRRPRNEVELEAIGDVNELSAEVTSRDVFPGAQLTASDLRP